MNTITTSITTCGDAHSPHARVSFDRSKEHLQRRRASSLSGKGARCSMSTTHPAMDEHHQPQRYEIRLKGHLGTWRADWFEDLTITALNNGETLLTGLVVDQAALHGVLKKV